MSTYARIQNGVVVEIIQSAIDSEGNAVPMADMFNAALIDGTISYMTDVTNTSPTPAPNWIATQTGAAWTFVAPAAPE